MTFEIGFQKLGAHLPPEKVDCLVAMAQFTFFNTFSHYEDSDLQSYLEKNLSLEVIQSELADSNNHFFFVLVQGIEAGFIKCVFPAESYLEHVNLKADQPLLLQKFYFLPDYCGQGIAPVALAFVESYAKHQLTADYLYLSVWDRNYRAQSFYQKHGFRTLGSFGFPVGKVTDHELLFGKSLA